jgi:hypothetical protein
VNDDRLRDLYAAAIDSDAVQREEGHASPEALSALARREGPEGARLATLDHVMSCRECRADFDLLRSIEAAGEQIGTAHGSRRRAWLVPVALAASLLVAVGVGRIVTRPAQDELTRGGEAAISPLRPGPSAIAGESLTFVWTAVPGARAYSLEVLDTGGRVVLMAETSDTMATPAMATRLPPADYTWWVRATTSDARTVRSPMRPLRLTPR